MADLPPYADSDGDDRRGADRGSTPGTPRWVAVFGITVLVLVLLILFVLLAGGGPGGHGPARH